MANDELKAPGSAAPTPAPRVPTPEARPRPRPAGGPRRPVPAPEGPLDVGEERSRGAPTSRTGVVRAAARAEAIETDYWYLTDRTKNRYIERAEQIARDAGIALPDPVGSATPAEAAAAFDAPPQVVDTAAAKAARRQALIEARRADPATFSGVAITDGEIEYAARAELQAQYDDAVETMARAPDTLMGRYVPEFVGRMGTAGTDEVNTAVTVGTLGIGASASLGRTILMETGASMVGEALTLPDQYRQAERLDVPDPDPVQQLTFAAAAGVVLPSAVRAAEMSGRGVKAALQRRRNREIADDMRQRQAALSPTERGAIQAIDRQTAEHDHGPAADPNSNSAAITSAEHDIEAGQPPSPPPPPSADAVDTLTTPRRDEPEPAAVAPSAPPRPLTVAADGNTGYAYGRFVDLGYPPHVAAALVGNLMQEGGPTIDVRAVGDGGDSIGGGQWNGPRAQALLDFAASRDIDPMTIEAQVEFLHYELETSEAGAAEALARTSTVNEATIVASQEYWRPGVPKLPNRVAYAQRIASEFGGARGGRRPVEDVDIRYGYFDGTVRSQEVAPDVLAGIRSSVAPLGPGINVVITSGGQARAGTGGPRTGSTRHDAGGAADLYLTRDGERVTPADDPELYARFLHGAASRFTGIGHYDWGVHVGGGSVASWGPDTTASTIDPRFAAAIEAGRRGATYGPGVRPGAIPAPVRVRAASVQADPRAYQFRSDAGADGVATPLSRVSEWDELLAGDTIIHERLDGSRYIADGHHRLDLSRRLEQGGHQPIEFNAYVLREDDGWSVEQVRARAALKNIENGNASVIDVAKVLRVDPELLERMTLRSTEARDGRGLMRLGDDGFDMVTNELVRPDQAAFVGELTSDAAMQSAILRTLIRAKPRSMDEARQVARDAYRAGQDRAAADSQLSLFGDDDQMETLFAERAKVMAAALSQLRRDRRAFGTLIRERTRLQEAGNALAEETNVRRHSTDEAAIDLIETLVNRAGPLDDALTSAARSVRGGAPVTRAVDEFVGDVRGRIEAGDIGRLLSGDDGSAPRAPAPDGGEDAPDVTPDGDAAARAADDQLEDAPDPTPITSGLGDLFDDPAPAAAGPTSQADAAWNDLTAALDAGEDFSVPTGRETNGEPETMSLREVMAELEEDDMFVEAVNACKP